MSIKKISVYDQEKIDALKKVGYRTVGNPTPNTVVLARPVKGWEY